MKLAIYLIPLFVFTSAFRANAADGETSQIVGAFAKGEIAVRPEALHQELDAQTVADLELGLLISQLQTFAPTQLSKERIEWLLKNPYLDRREILERQIAIQTIAEDEELFQALEQIFELPERGTIARALSGIVKSPDSIGKKSLVENSLASSIRGIRPMQLFSFAMTGYFQWALVSELIHLPQHPLSSLLKAPFFALSIGIYSMTNNSHVPMVAAKIRAQQLLAIKETNVLNSGDSSEALRELGMLCGENLTCARKMLLAGKTYPERTWIANLARILGLAPVLTLPSTLYAQSHKEDLAKVTALVTELETYYAFAKFYREHREELTWPEIEPSGRADLEIEQGQHPSLWLNNKAVIPNSVKLQQDGAKTMIVTGPNTGGKTTFQQMSLDLAVMAMAGLPVPAEKMRISPAYLMTNFTTNSGNLEKGVSSFESQAQRVSDIANFALSSERHYPLILGMDEILTGTSGDEHAALERGTLSILHEMPDILLTVATHDRTLANMAAELFVDAASPQVVNVHVTLEGHRISNGVSTDYNATDVMKKVDAPSVLIERAQRYLEKEMPRPVDVSCEKDLHEQRRR